MHRCDVKQRSDLSREVRGVHTFHHFQFVLLVIMIVLRWNGCRMPCIRWAALSVITVLKCL